MKDRKKEKRRLMMLLFISQFFVVIIIMAFLTEISFLLLGMILEAGNAWDISLSLVMTITFFYIIEFYKQL